MAVEVLGFPTTQGLPRQALRHGPEALRRAGLLPLLRAADAGTRDLGDLIPAAGLSQDPVPDRVAKVVAAARHQKEFWLCHHRPGALMLTIGGDHTTSLGTIWALRAMGHRFDTIWIDAHGDFNILETSPSGNPHGMVLALACGLIPRHLGPLIAPSDLHLWGVRDLDPGERKLLARAKVTPLSPNQLRRDWHRLRRRLGADIFISFDIDAVDPTEAPGTMTPVPGGLHRCEALELIAAVARHRRLLALDIVEYHPDRDRNNLTAQLGLGAALAAVSGQIVRCGPPGRCAAAAR